MEKKLYTIGQVSKLLKMTPRAVRFYQELGLVVPTKTENETNYRYYSDEDVAKLKKILYLKEVGLSLEEVKLYFEYPENKKIALLQMKVDKNRSISSMLEKIISRKDYDIENVDDVNIFGSKIQRKDLKKLKGVWKLDSAYLGINDAKKGENPIQKFSPYQFLAFDEHGMSPWFYYADDQRIVFNTFFQPTSEIYQVKGEKLYLQISNPSEHIFFNCDESECILSSHILVFDKFSDNYDDYQKFLVVDKKPTGLIDKNLVGVWNYVGLSDTFSAQTFMKEESDDVMIVQNDGQVKFYKNDQLMKMQACNGEIYNEKLSASCKYKIENEYLVLENKTRVYKFAGKLQKYLVFKKENKLSV